MYELAPDAKAFESIQELVEHFRTHSLNRHFPGMETTLDHPFKDQVSAKGNMSVCMLTFWCIGYKLRLVTSFYADIMFLKRV